MKTKYLVSNSQLISLVEAAQSFGRSNMNGSFFNEHRNEMNRILQEIKELEISWKDAKRFVGLEASSIVLNRTPLLIKRYVTDSYSGQKVATVEIAYAMTKNHIQTKTGYLSPKKDKFEWMSLFIEIK